MSDFEPTLIADATCWMRSRSRLASGDEYLGPAELEALRQVARHRGHEPRECGLPSVADSFRGAAVRDAGQTAGEDGVTDE